MNERGGTLPDGYRLEVVAGCNQGPCPKVGVREARPGRLIIQGSRVPDTERAALGEIPDHEDVVEVPDALLLEYARRLRGEGRV